MLNPRQFTHCPCPSYCDRQRHTVLSYYIKLRTKQWLLPIKQLGELGSYFHFLLSRPRLFFSFHSLLLFVEPYLQRPSYHAVRLQERKRLNLLHSCNKASIKHKGRYVHHNTTCKEAHPSGCMHVIKGVNRSVTTNRPTI